MNLASFSFLAFFVIILTIYGLIPQKLKWIVLLISSIFFLFYDNFAYTYLINLLLILFSSYLGAILIQKYRGTKYALVSCFISIVIILMQLVYLKYTNLFGNLGAGIYNLFGGSYIYQEVYHKTPLGISYYTLIMLGYLISVYRGEIKPQPNIFKLSLFMIYFPQLTSGPFTRYKEMEEELYIGRRLNFKIVINGFIRILWGLFKILVISSRLGIFVDNVYSNLNILNGFYILIAMMFYTLQLYTNFSGSIDIIMGTSECLNIKLPENFRNPFFAKSITEFWRRWHITLGAWLRDFIFYPLLKSRFIQKLTLKAKKRLGKKWGKKLPLYLSMLILWLLIGIWHGGAYHYILASGLLQFIFIVLEDLTEPLSRKVVNKLKINVNNFYFKIFQCVKTFALFSLAMIFFRASSISEGVNIIKAGINGNFNLSQLTLTGLNLVDFLIVIMALIILFSIELMQRKVSVREVLQQKPFIIRSSLVFILILIVIIFGIYGIGFDASEFVYSKF